MVIRIHKKPGHEAPMELSIPVGSEVEIHLYPGDIPIIEPHRVDGEQIDVRTFDVIVDANGDFRCDQVNVTEVANGES